MYANMDENIVHDAVLLSSFTIKNKRCRVYLHRGVLVWETERSPYKRCSLTMSDVVAVHPVHQGNMCCSELSQSTPASPSSHTTSPKMDKERRKASECSPPCHVAFTLHYAEATSKNRWRLRRVTLKHTDPRQVASWVKTIRNMLRAFKNRPKKLLVFVNPFGGKKRGLKVYEKQVAPLLTVAGISSNVVVTEGVHHAYDSLLSSTNLDGVDGVACVGGDGTFAEVLNGLVLRAARDAQQDTNGDETVAPPKLRVGMVPAGSTDAVAFCIHGTNDVQTAVLHIILGEDRGLDLCSVHSNGNLLRFYASMLSYGYLGDVIKDSERFRWMGPHRYDYSGFKKLMANRGYEGEIRLRTCSSDPCKGGKCHARCQQCSSNHVEHDKEEWRTVSGRFFMVNGANLSCACPHSPNGIAPLCHVGSGCVDVVLVRRTSILNNLRLLLRLSSATRTLYDLSFVEVYRAHEFTFSPAPNSKHSVWNCDGEVLLDSNVQVRVHRQLVRVFARSLMQPAGCVTEVTAS